RGREAMAALPRAGSLWHRAACCVAVASRRMGDRNGLGDTGRELASLRPDDFGGPIELRCAGRVALQLVVAGLGRSGARHIRAVVGERERKAPTTDRLATIWIWAAHAMVAMFEGDSTVFLRDGDRMIASALASGDARTSCNFRH